MTRANRGDFSAMAAISAAARYDDLPARTVQGKVAAPRGAFQTVDAAR